MEKSKTTGIFTSAEVKAMAKMNKREREKFTKDKKEKIQRLKRRSW